jgi:hypothetical protein
VSTPLHFRVLPRLIELLGAQYRSTEVAIKELVANAWDADATQVAISLPEPLSPAPVVISDNGYGMSPSEIEKLYLSVAHDRRSQGGAVTPKGRKVRGYRGVGKFAGLIAADTMSVTTIARGTWSRLVISRSRLEKEAEDLEAADILTATRHGVEGHGTTVELAGLRQDFAFPDPDKLGRILLREFGRQDDFAITINGVLSTPALLDGEKVPVQFPLGEAGVAGGNIWFLEEQRAIADPGVIVRVDGRAIGEPTFFGLEDDPDIPRSLLQRVAGEVDASALVNQVQTNWGGFVENALGSRALTEEAREWLKRELLRRRDDEVASGREAFIQEHAEQLALIPNTRRDQARRALLRVFDRFFEEAQEKRRAIAELVLNAFERDEYWVVARRIDEAPKEDILRLAEVLHDWGLTEAAGVVARAKARLKALTAFQQLAHDRRTLEAQMHHALEGNVWIFGDVYEMLKSNATLRRIVRRLTDQVYRGRRGKERPDLLLVGSMDRYLLIELKRPSRTISHDDVAQAQKYRDELLQYLGNRGGPIELAVVGGQVDPLVPRSLHKDQWADSYDGLVATARARLEWLIENLSPEAEALA